VRAFLALCLAWVGPSVALAQTPVAIVRGECPSSIAETELAARVAIETRVEIVSRELRPDAIAISYAEIPCPAEEGILRVSIRDPEGTPLRGPDEIELGSLPRELHARVLALWVASVLPEVRPAVREESAPAPREIPPSLLASLLDRPREPIEGPPAPITPVERSFWRLGIGASARHFPATVASSIGGAIALVLRAPEIGFLAYQIDVGGAGFWTDDGADIGMLEGGFALLVPIELAPGAAELELGARASIAYAWIEAANESIAHVDGIVGAISVIARGIARVGRFGVFVEGEAGGSTRYGTELSYPDSGIPLEPIEWPHIEGLFVRGSLGMTIE
jgi:hypothetical protein